MVLLNLAPSTCCDDALMVLLFCKYYMGYLPLCFSNSSVRLSFDLSLTSSIAHHPPDCKDFKTPSPTCLAILLKSFALPYKTLFVRQCVYQIWTCSSLCKDTATSRQPTNPFPLIQSVCTSISSTVSLTLPLIYIMKYRKEPYRVTRRSLAKWMKRRVLQSHW